MTKDKALEISIQWMEGLIQFLPSTKEHEATMRRYEKAIIAIKEVLAHTESEKELQFVPVQRELI